MRLFVLKAVIASDVAFRRRKKNDAENSTTHCVFCPAQVGLAGLSRRNRPGLRPISFAAA